MSNEFGNAHGSITRRRLPTRSVSRRVRRRYVQLACLVPAGIVLAIGYFIVQSMVNQESASASRVLGAGLTGVIVTLLVGGFELLYLPSKHAESLRRRPFATLLFVRTLAMTVAVVLGLSIGNALFMPTVMIEYWLGSPILIDTAIAFFLCATVLFIFQVREIIGRRVLASFVLGRYFRPIEESRVFLFLDIANSTQLAQRLGDRGTHALISRFFFDIAGPVLEFGGETHRYIGDQVVVTWEESKGLQNASCLRCVLAIDTEIEARAAYYQQAFGVVPRFRAGLHCGPVVAGECGDDKREIVYFGDTVNTAARIEARCRDLGRPILASATLIHSLDLPDELRAVPLGHHDLRGREEPIELYAISRSRGAGARHQDDSA